MDEISVSKVELFKGPASNISSHSMQQGYLEQHSLVTTLIVISVLFDSTGFLPLQELHNTCKRFNVPAKHDMLRALLEKVERNDRNDANYEQFLKLLNWRDSPGKKLNLASVLAGWGRKGNVTF